MTASECGPPRPPTSIRAARGEDLEALAALEAAAFGAEAWSLRLVADELAAPGALVLVAGSGPPAAYACFRRPPGGGAGEAELLRVAVSPAARRRGLASALLAAGLERLRAEGAAACLLEVAAGNEAAIALYRRLGFRTEGRRPRYYPSGADALLMRLDLGRAAGS